MRLKRRYKSSLNNTWTIFVLLATILSTEYVSIYELRGKQEGLELKNLARQKIKNNIHILRRMRKVDCIENYPSLLKIHNKAKS